MAKEKSLELAVVPRWKEDDVYSDAAVRHLPDLIRTMTAWSSLPAGSLASLGSHSGKPASHVELPMDEMRVEKQLKGGLRFSDR